MIGKASIRATRRLIQTAFATVTIAITAMLGIVAAPAVATPSTEEEVYRALGVDEVAAEYVILIDTSASMQQGSDLYNVVKQSLRGFLAALSKTDKVALVTFDSTARLDFHGLAGDVPDDLIAKLPQTATGKNTDIGRALEKAVEILQSSTVPIATVVMFTDGLHDPPPRSPYPYSSGGSWRTLSQSAALIQKESLVGYSVPLKGETDAGLLKTIVPAATVLSMSSVSQLTSILEVPRQASRAAKARSRLGDDTGRGIVIAWPTKLLNLSAGENRTRLTIRSTTNRIPLDVSGLTVTSSDDRIRVRLDTDRLTLRPGEQKQVGLVVSWDAGPDTWVPFTVQRISAKLTATGAVESPWSAVLQNLQVAFKPRIEQTVQPVTGAAQRGRLMVWAIVLAVSILAAIVFLGIRRRAANPPMFGRLLAASPTTGHQLGAVDLFGRHMSIGPATLHVPGHGTVSSSRGKDGVALRISYSPKDAPERLESAHCRLGQLVILNGVAFEWTNSDTS